MAPPATAIEVPVFVDTSLGTHIVFSVSPDLTADEFKRKFEMMHLNQYPGIGSIKVVGLMIKKRSHVYHVPESMAIKHVFDGSMRPSFLHVEACPKNMKMPPTARSEAVNVCLSQNRIENEYEKPRKKAKVMDFPVPSVEQTSDRMSEAISVSGIIRKYFCVFDDEATSSNSKSRAPNCDPKTPPTIGGPRKKKKASEVGKRFIVAANKLGISSSDKNAMVSLCKHKCDKFSVPRSSVPVRHPVFEIGED